MPVGYGTTYSTSQLDVHFENTSQNLGEIGIAQIRTYTPSTRLTTTDTSQKIYTQSLATWSGNVPAGTDQFYLTGGTIAPQISFQSDGWSGTKGTLKGTVSCWMGYGASHSAYTNKLYPVQSALYFQYEGDSDFTHIRDLTCANGVATINEPVESPVSKIMVVFRWGSWTKYKNNFPSPTIAWGFTYIDEMSWETSSITSGAQIVDEQRTTNNLITSIISAVNNIFQSITELPQKIASALQGLFIPDEQNINIIRGKWQEFLVTKMGFIYQMFQWVDTFFDGIIDGLSGSDDGAFTIPAFPAFEAGGETVQLWSEPLTVDFSDNAFVQTLQPIACPFILGVTAYHLWFSMSDLMECFFAGKSYRDFSHRRDSD